MDQKAQVLVSGLLWHISERCHLLIPNFQAFTSSEHPHFYSSEKSQNSSNWWLFWSKLYLDCLFLFSAWDPWGFWFNWFGHLPQSELFKYNQHNTSHSGCKSESQYLRKRHTCVQKWETIHECWGAGEGRAVEKDVETTSLSHVSRDSSRSYRAIHLYDHSFISVHSFVLQESRLLQESLHGLPASLLAPVQTIFCSPDCDLSTVPCYSQGRMQAL